MSHNTSALAPYITEHTAALSTAGAGQSLVIKGFGLGLSTVVDIPSALGVETARAFTKTGATAGVLTITVTVEFLPSTAVSRSISISMGGVPCQGVGVTAGAITVTHGFIPSNLSSLVAWYDAADVSTITKDSSDLVGQWDDKSGNGFHAIQGTEINKPKYHASGGGIGQQHIQFGHNDPTHNWLTVAGPTVWATPSAGGKFNSSIFAVIHWPDTDGQNISDIVLMDQSKTFGVGKQNDRGIVMYFGGFRADGGTAPASLPDKFLAGWVISDSAWITRLNGAVDDSDNRPQTGNYSLSDSNWEINRSSTGPHFEVSELLIFDAELTGDDLSDVEGYLNAKWSIY